ncbi:Galactosylgalactosylxylosylprotein 3-beta-glucuronosyltransferase [Aphelenchoides fujianensis]|nr:Galactosylgalactosylxylosylprotein 3-beta-glucuronosyltransferase [Aphelenchoides fujianensis]
MNDQYLPKILIALGLFMFCQMVVFWGRLAEMGDSKMTLEAEVATLERRKDSLDHKLAEMEREKHRMELKLEKLDFQIRDLLPLTKNRLHLPTIFFITPTKRRPAQKADLIRLDAERPSPAIDEILARTRLKSVHLTAATPEDKRLGDHDPNWRLPRGVVQRNTALDWIRSNYAGPAKGRRLLRGRRQRLRLAAIRSVQKVGVWPVGLVGGLLVETPVLSDGRIVDFSATWKKERPFPIDMAAFAVNITLLNEHPTAAFSYDVPRGYQESHFLTGLGLKRSDLEPKADFCTKILVWHTRTEAPTLHPPEKKKFANGTLLSDLERDGLI